MRHGPMAKPLMTVHIRAWHLWALLSVGLLASGILAWARATLLTLGTIWLACCGFVVSGLVVGALTASAWRFATLMLRHSQADQLTMQLREKQHAHLLSLTGEELDRRTTQLQRGY